MNLELVYFKSDDSRRAFHVKGDHCLIGRQPTCDLQIPLRNVSREHCEIRIVDDEVLVRDLSSSNGVYCNGDRIEQETTLAAGDQLAIGAIVFTVRIDGEPRHIEPPLMEAPIASAARSQPTAQTNDAGASEEAPAANAHPDDSASDIGDLIARASKAVNDDSSVFDFDIDLDDD